MGELVRIIHPETLGTAEVDEGAMPHYYRSGWRLLTGDEEAGLAAQQEEPAPEPVTREQAAELAAGTTEPGEARGEEL
jgi:hypothetical protein